jgi:hypothetical protein
VEYNPNAAAHSLRQAYLREGVSYADYIRREAIRIADLPDNDDCDCRRSDHKDDLRKFQGLVQAVNMVAACMPNFPPALADVPDDEVTLSKASLVELQKRIEELQLLTSYASSRLLEGYQRLDWEDAPDAEEAKAIKERIDKEREAIVPDR